MKTIEPPAWVQELRPAEAPFLAPLRSGSAVLAWHVEIVFKPWPVPEGQAISGGDNWNGKALVVGGDSGLNRSVGEVEIAARLRSDGASAGWSGKPRDPWSRWALDPLAREGWIAQLDRRVRHASALLKANSRGFPDVLRWRIGLQDFCCAEYKGPSPTRPTRLDSIKPEQEAWLESACGFCLLSSDRIAIVSWRPNATAAQMLRKQAAASKLGRIQRKA